ncbi:MAG: hypothetical protein IAE65_02460 [Ignavibacteria bacterium]|nr:hypothetical protein [Ignavibacteria bacterium]
MDLGADRRGVNMGPSAIRYANLEKKLENLGYKVTNIGDIDEEIMETQQLRNAKLKFLPEIVRTSKTLAKKSNLFLIENIFP